MQIRKGRNGDYYIFKREGRTERDWFLVKYAPALSEEIGMINLSTGVKLPKEFIGKRIRLKVELIEDKESD